MLGKSYSEQIDFVQYQWSGKHYREVKVIGLITLVWTDGKISLPVDFINNIDEDNKNKSDNFCDFNDGSLFRRASTKPVI